MAKIFLNAFDKAYDVIGFKHSMFRAYDTDSYCYPKSGLVGGFFQVEFASGADVSFLEKMVMIEWGERNLGRLSDDDYVRMNCFSGKLSCQFDEGGSGKVYEWKHAIVSYYEEIIHSLTGEPMKTRVVFSPFDLRVNNLLISRYSGKAEKGTWYFYEPEEEEQSKPAPKPTILVTKVDGKEEAQPNEKVTYQVTEFNQKQVSENDKKRIHWQVKVDGKKSEEFLRHGEKLELTIKEEWAGKEIIVMPFLVKPDEKNVSKKTRIIVKMAIIFVNGYWNTGNTVGNKVGKINEKLGKSIEEIIRDNTGDKFGKEYWGLGFKIKAFEYFKRSVKEMYNFEIFENYQTPNKKYIKDIYIDGADVWSSTGQLRFGKGLKEAMSDKFKIDLIDKGILSQENKKQAPIFVISHSMGGAHAEGIVQGLLKQGIEVDRVLHFSPADNKDFKITLPNKTYQVNILPDIVLMYKNFDDVMGTLPEKIWDDIKGIFSEKEKLEKNAYQINGLKNEHFKLKISNETTMANHYYTKSTEVWEQVEFLKE